MSELLEVRNLGIAMLKELSAVGVNTLDELKRENGDHLYLKICAQNNRLRDPKMHDICLSIIHNAKTGEKLSWPHWSQLRKKRIKKMMWEKYIVDSFTDEEKSKYGINSLIPYQAHMSEQSQDICEGTKVSQDICEGTKVSQDICEGTKVSQNIISNELLEDQSSHPPMPL